MAAVVGIHQIHASKQKAEDLQYWTVKEVAAFLRVSETTVIRTFQDEPGVLQLNKKRALRGRRPHVSLRIPDTLLRRQLREWSCAE